MTALFHRTQSRKMQRHLLHDAGVLLLGKKITQTRKSSAKRGLKGFIVFNRNLYLAFKQKQAWSV